MSKTRRVKLLFYFLARVSSILILLSMVSGAAYAEIIRSFHSEIRMQKDSSFHVKEIIKIGFEGSQRHGIFRTIPVVYDRNGGKYTIYLNLQSVLQDGVAAKYSAKRQGRDLNIKIGDGDKKISGDHTYEITYTVRRGINFFEEAPELYWNVTGNEWPFEIENASARIYPPEGVSVDQINHAGYFGPLGSTNRATEKVEEKSLLFYTKNLSPSEGLTVIAVFPAGSVEKPSILQQFMWFFGDWWAVFTFPLLTISVMYWLYQQNGRDIEGNLPAQVEWNPPKDLTPAEVGTLIDERCDMADIISTLIDLAARGYLHIEEIKSEKFLFFQNSDYAFTRSNQKVDDLDFKLARHETQFLQGIFGDQNALGRRVLLSSLKEHFYVYLEPMKAQIYSSLTTKGLFITNPETERQKFVGAGFVIGLVGILLILFGVTIFNNISYGIGLLVAGIIVAVFSKAMPAKTATGSRKLRECIGFQRFVKLAEKDRIQKLITDDPTIFGRLLPYAMVLGVADEWADKFAGLMKEPPDWYAPYGGWHGGFYSGLFVNQLGSSMNSMGSTFSSKPQSNAGSGGSGYSGGGGGGYSGGGFGGGGGGSW